MTKHRIRPLYRELASTIEARKNCECTCASGSHTCHYSEAFETHVKTISKLVDLLPSGSGWDSGTKIELDQSHANKLVLYHHMNDAGFYDGYTDHTIVVTPNLTSDFDLRISGRNRNDIKDYLYQTFDYALRQDVAYWLYLDRFPQFKVSHRWIDQCTQEFLVQVNTDENVTSIQTFASLDDARSFAADLMEQAFYAPKENN